MAKQLTEGTPIEGGFAFKDGHLLIDPRSTLVHAHTLAVKHTRRAMHYIGQDDHGWRIFEPATEGER